MALITRALKPRKIFEIGTFRGRTALNFALNSCEECVIYTLDLPAGEMGDTLAAADNRLTHMREPDADYRDSDVSHKIQQLYGDSATYDFSPYADNIDIVFVDGGHTYDLVVNDTKVALSMCRSGGMILWHDFANYGDYNDVTRGILDTIPRGRVIQIERSELAAYRVP